MFLVALHQHAILKFLSNRARFALFSHTILVMRHYFQRIHACISHGV
ncbi:MAG: hypothetical protein ACTTJS_03335 [Wolinella sp.]